MYGLGRVLLICFAFSIAPACAGEIPRAEQELIAELEALTTYIGRSPLTTADANAVSDITCKIARTAAESGLLDRLPKTAPDERQNFDGEKFAQFLQFEEQQLRKSGASTRAVEAVLAFLKGRPPVDPKAFVRQSDVQSVEAYACPGWRRTEIMVKPNAAAGSLIKASLGIVTIVIDLSAGIETFGLVLILSHFSELVGGEAVHGGPSRTKASAENRLNLNIVHNWV